MIVLYITGANFILSVPAASEAHSATTTTTTTTTPFNYVFSGFNSRLNKHEIKSYFGSCTQISAKGTEGNDD